MSSSTLSLTLTTIQSRHAVLWLLLSAKLIAATTLPGAAPQPKFAKGPYLQAPGSNTMTLMWEAPAAIAARVHYGIGRQLDFQETVREPEELTGVSTRLVTNQVHGQKPIVVSLSETNRFYLYSATLRGLRPGTLYRYEVELGGARSARSSFRTWEDTSGRARFVAYGDSRSLPDVHTALARRFSNYSPGFILHTGDLVARGQDYALWEREFFKPLAGVLDRVPLFPVLGNHEQNGTNYFAYFNLPESERWYSFDCGPVHVIALDFHYEKAAHEQFEFARRDLTSSRASWKVALLHYPMFNVGGHGTTWGHEAYLPLFHKAGVDLVLSGHSHIYERFRPVAPRAALNGGGIVHITTGGGGAPLYNAPSHPALVRQAATNHFMFFEATSQRLVGRAITLQGRTLDRFELRKQGVNREIRPHVGAMAEELLKISFEIGGGLQGRLTAVPGPNTPTPTLVALPSLKTVRQPIDLEIRLSPESRQVYEMLDQQMTGTTAGPGETNRTVWLQVRSTGRQSISSSSSGVLSPALVFEARFRYEGEEGLAIGGRSTVSTNAARLWREWVTEASPGPQ